MYPWNCCRMCASVQSLHPIFLLPRHSEKYSSVIFQTTGIKVAMNDSLPQDMCSTCISFINESIKFRRKCEEMQKILTDNKTNGIKFETFNILKTEENSTSINIIDALDDDFKDLDDNITLDNLQFNDIVLKDEGKNTEIADEPKQMKYEARVIEIDEKPMDIMFKTKKRKAKSIKVKQKESKEKTERVREEIECEYCHKILTSKLSLRNHYKIHTGFDVVCEHCGKKFITRRLLLMHCRAKHGYEKTDKCSYCDYKASNAEQVKIHERLHTGEKPFVCKECNAGFHRKSSYLQHIAIHLPEKTVQCDQCPARFKSVTLMRIHKNRHRPSQYTFKCGVCDNSFARRRNVARHLQRVHGLPPDHQIHRIKIH
ncbi:zinc finger protein 510-like [Melitaea cinxia]|uniref:zinc finger protein 510-like n=1 Tax=Melitaea cinxia TaxID=113334 RepID=UPI001E270E81|nr:zinc finger protein 510-like [Melitaea cinxia]